MTKKDAISFLEEAIRLLGHRLSQTETQIRDLRKMVSALQSSNAAVEHIADKFKVYGGPKS